MADADAAVAAPAVEQEKKDMEPQEAAGGEGLGPAWVVEEAAKRDEEQQLGGKAEQASAPAGQPSTEPALTCAGLDTGIVIEELISNEAEGKAGDEAEVQVPMGKNSIEVQEPAGSEEPQQPASGPRITTTVGENEAVVVLASADAAEAEAGQNEKAQKSCVVNMASLDEEQKGKKAAAAGKKETPAKTNGSARAKKTAEAAGAAAAKPTTEPKKRGRKPGSGKKQNSPPKNSVDLTAQPFTPAQQMQLRAQILVYGALIQSTLPDESLMSASYFDASKVRGTENFESYYGATKSTWDKTWKAAYDRIKKASGQAPKLVSFAAAHVAPGIRSPAAPGATTFATPGLPPKSGSSKAGGKTNNSTLPTGPETGYSSMASATVASWSARNRAPDPNSWNLYPGAPPPRFPFPQGSPPPATTMGPWGAASTTGYFPPTTFPATPPAFAQPVPPTAAGEPQAKRRKVAANGTTQPGDADKIEESVRAVEQARRTAEEMATASDSVVQQSHRVWKEMKEKVTSNSATAKEAQVAACMAAMTAASSVARAASAAANVAYAAAMQAKAMAIEAAKGRDEDPSVTHAMQGEDQFIAGVKQAARSQAKSAFLIAQQAENIGAIVRAAEMASEAARQASSIMAIGNPAAEKSPKAKNNSNNSNNNSNSNRKNSVRGGRGQVGRGKKNEDREPKGEKPSELANTNTNDAVMEDAEQQQQQQQQQNAEPAEGMVEDRQQFKPTDIKEGSHVEIKPGEEEGLKGVWFSAKVLEIKEEKALVVYDDLLDEDGQGDHLKEWVDLTAQLDNVPRVRTAHPMTTEASAKKKRRAAMGNQIWLKGDHVDVWMRDGWWEGIVQAAEDEKVTVFFPADGDSDVTKSWNMRPSLIWHEGAWIPWRETRKEKMEAGSSQDDSADMETPKPRSGAKPTKRKKFSDVMEKEHEQRKRLLEEQAKSTPKSGSKRKKPSSDRKRSTSSEVTSDVETDVKKSSRPAISKSTSKGAAKKHGS